MKKLLLFFLLLFTACTTPKENKVYNLTIDSTGIVKWDFITTEKEISFDVEYTYANRWDRYRPLNPLRVNIDTLNRTDSNYYTLNSHVVFGGEKEKFRIKMYGIDDTCFSNVYVINYQAPWLSAIDKEFYGDTFKLKWKTYFVLHNEDGIILNEGFDDKIPFKGLVPYKHYHIDAANFFGSVPYITEDHVH